MKVTLYKGKDGSSHEFSRQDIHSLVFSNPDSGAACGGKFPSNGTGIFLAPKTGTGLSCTIYEIPVKFSLSLDMKPGTSHPNKCMVQKISAVSVKTGTR